MGGRNPREGCRYWNEDLRRKRIWLRATVGFRKIDQKWTITHWHESVPFYMDGSYKAAIDLKP